MRKFHVTCLLILLNAMLSTALYGQQKLFNKIDFGNNARVGISGITQDQQGYIWFTAENTGLVRYDGATFSNYIHSEKDTNSISGAPTETLAVDAAGAIWIGTLGGGMDKFDPATNRFTHFRHRPGNPLSISHDTVTAILEDHLGNLWVGTYNGLDLYNRKTGTFTHHQYSATNPNSLSGTHVRALYEDKAGTLWVGCGSPWPNEESWKDEGGLNRFDRATGTFTRYLHNPNDPASLENNKVRALLEDSKGNFWVGTGGDGLQILDRRSGKFVHYHYDPAHPEGLSRGYWDGTTAYDQVEFIKEDAKGSIWIGTYGAGIVEYDPQLRKITHHGYTMMRGKAQADTATGFNDDQAWSSIVTKDGLLWISTLSGNLYNISLSKKVVLPFTNNKDGGISFYEANGVLWVGTVNGLLRKDEKTGNEKRFTDPIDSLKGSNVIIAIAADSKGRLWLGTNGGGLSYFDPQASGFIHYKYDPKNRSALRDSFFASLWIDDADYLWFGTRNFGIYTLNTRTGETKNFLYDSIRNNFFNYPPLTITGTKKDVWFATDYGVGKLEIASGEMKRYLPNSNMRSIVVDNSGMVWAGALNGLYYYNSVEDKFDAFDSPNVTVKNIIGIVKDTGGNLWISTASAIFALNTKDRSVRIYGSEMGVHANTFPYTHDCVSANGELFIGDQLGYYHFYPDSVKTEFSPPSLNFASLQIGGKEMSAGAGNILNKPLYAIEELKLPNDKNSFSIGFSAIDFQMPGEKRVIYMLKNYDNQWHETNADQRAYFYNLPVGKYLLHVRAINAAGAWSEKILSIVIMPPWWQTWWALTLFAIVLIGIVLGFSYYRSYNLRKENQVLEEKVAHRTAQLQKSLENLKAAQQQLIQSEKMASLGELTAGIAHEIQNPLNFINNFSEVNTELIEELKEMRAKMNGTKEAHLEDEILDGLAQNLQKILHHGKRADSIVKGMLQHSRSSTGEKQSTNINALADEYLRLSYHGLRARDKSFNAEIKTTFDESIGAISIVPQDIGRVLLNFFNNAFYAVAEKKKQLNGSYTPLVTVATTSENGNIVVNICDNGTGIPQKALDKIFQPFFTTKPTGEGTGLGLSLSYDIIQAHGGDINVETREGEGTTFIVKLPCKDA